MTTYKLDDIWDWIIGGSDDDDDEDEEQIIRKRGKDYL